MILIYNYDSTDEIKEIGGVPVVEETKYLGIKIVSKRDLFRVGMHQIFGPAGFLELSGIRFPAGLIGDPAG